MEARTLANQVLDDVAIARLLLRKRYIAEGQLRAALDYQKSLGGRLLDILIKLDLVRLAQLEVFLNKVAAGEEPPECEDGIPSLDPSAVACTDLKVHRRLLDKVPAELVARYLLVVFFPLPGGDSRRIILGHGQPVPAEVCDRLRSTLGVNLATLALERHEALHFLDKAGKLPPGMEAPPAPTAPPPAVAHGAAHAATGPPGKNAGSRVVATEIGFLVNLLVRKGIITPEELEAFARVQELARKS